MTEEEGEGQEASKGKPRKRVVVIFLMVVTVAALGVWICSKLFFQGRESTDDAEIQGNQAIISSQTLGQIRSLEVDRGDKITKGQIVATLDDHAQQAQKDQVVNAIEQAKANLDRAKVSAVSSLATVQMNEVKLAQAKSDLDRATTQRKTGILSQEQFEHIKLATDTASASYNIAVGQQHLAEAEEKSAEAQLKSAQSQMETVEANMAHVIMTAPIDGVVARKWVMPMKPSPTTATSTGPGVCIESEEDIFYSAERNTTSRAVRMSATRCAPASRSITKLPAN